MKYQGLALLATVLAHVALLLLLWMLQLRQERPTPKPAEVLVAVNVGNVPEAAGDIEPGGTPDDPASTAEEVPATPAPAPVPQPKAPPTPPAPQVTPRPQPKAQPEPVQTQSHEASIQAEQARRAEAEKKAKAQAEAAARAAEAAAQARAEASRRIGQSVAGAFGKQAGAAGSQGTGAGKGNQGDPQGSASSYALAGRKIVSNGGALVQPIVHRAVKGTVRVRIVVDDSGQVQRATISSGTNIADPAIRQAAIEAARKTRFNAVAGSDDQEGTIIYHFEIRA